MTSTTRTPRKRTSLRRGPVCAICKHEQRVLIEQTRVAGASLTNVARKFGVSRDGVHRHMTNHVSDDLKAEYLGGVPLRELAEKAASEGVSLLGYFSIVRATLMTQFQLAASVNDKNGTAVLAGRLTEVLREIGKVTGEIMRSPAVQNVTTNISFTSSPIFVDLQSMLIKRLAGHPGALAAVIDGLRELESRSAPRPIAGPVIEHEGVHAP